MEFDPETLAQQQERMASLQGLLRTYGLRMEDVLASRRSGRPRIARGRCR
ncbi:MAG: hypothetical protein ACLR3C_00115 [Eggerthella lenta]